MPQSTINLFLKVIAKIPPDVLAFRLREIGKLQYDGSKCNVNAIYIQATDDCLVTKNAENDFKTCFDGLQIKRVDGPHFILQANPAVCSKIIEEETSLRMITNPHQ